jgi:hypothetical protein
MGLIEMNIYDVHLTGKPCNTAAPSERHKARGNAVDTLPNVGEVIDKKGTRN